MTPIEKYQGKFIALLKEAEQELGDYLVVKISSAPLSRRDDGRIPPYKSIDCNGEYSFELHTNSFIY